MHFLGVLLDKINGGPWALQLPLLSCDNLFLHRVFVGVLSDFVHFWYNERIPGQVLSGEPSDVVSFPWQPLWSNTDGGHPIKVGAVIVIFVVSLLDLYGCTVACLQLRDSFQLPPFSVVPSVCTKICTLNWRLNAQTGSWLW